MIKCPNCGESFYTEGHSTTTAVYYPPVYKDGVNVNPDGNYTTTHCRCIKCKHDFTVQTRYGKVVSISDDGLRPEPVPTQADVNITSYNLKGESLTYVVKPEEIKTQMPWEALQEEIKEIKKRLDWLEQRVMDYWER